MKDIPRKTKLAWQERENTELEQKRRRRYLHFDPKIQRVDNSLRKKVTNPAFVQKHAFYPLLKRIQKSRHYKRESGKRVIKTKERPISYASHIDALIYSWYSALLESYYETTLESSGLGENVIAYRKLGKSNLDLAKEVFKYIANQPETVAVAFDVQGFYDTLDHQSLKQCWASVIHEALPPDHYKVFRSLTKYSYVMFDEIKYVINIHADAATKERLRLFLGIDILETLRGSGKVLTHKEVFGIPQGTPISCVLSNMYMQPFDLRVSKEVQGLGGLYRRYSDDIIVVCPTRNYERVVATVKTAIQERKLKIQDSKTETRFFQKDSSGELVCNDETGKTSALQYLGVVFDGKRLRLRHKGYAKFERNMTKAARREAHKALEQKRTVSKRGLYERFTPLGQMNYVTYVKRAANTLNSPQILKPVRRGLLIKKLKNRLEADTENTKGARKGHESYSHEQSSSPLTS